MNQWYYSKDGKSSLGPVSLETLKTMVDQGQLDANSLVQKEGAGKWVRVRSVKELSGTVAPSSRPPSRATMANDLEDLEPMEEDRPRTRGTTASPSARGEQEPWQFKAMRICAIGSMIIGGLLFFIIGGMFFIELIDRMNSSYFRFSSAFVFQMLMGIGSAFLCAFCMVATGIMIFFWIEVGRSLRDIRRVVLKHDKKEGV